MTMTSEADPLSKEYVAEIFKPLGEKGQGAKFMQYISETVDWTVMGTQPLPRHYSSRKALGEEALAKIGAGLQAPPVLKVSSILVCRDWAVVELYAENAFAKAGWQFDNKYCWICRFEKGIIVQARAYLDSALVTRLINESEGAHAAQ